MYNSYILAIINILHEFSIFLKTMLTERTYNLDQFTKMEARVHIVLDNIRSAFNVGSFFRTADAVGGVKIYLCGITADIDNPKLYKTALGALETVPSWYFGNPMDAIELLKTQNIPIFSIELTKDAQHFQKIVYPTPVALVFGHEREGVSQPILDNSQKTVFIPMNGKKESLNVANTGAIMMYEAIREK